MILREGVVYGVLMKHLSYANDFEYDIRRRPVSSPMKESELRLKTEMKKLRRKQQLEMANQLKEAAELEDELNKSKAENREKKALQMEMIRKEQEGIEADRLEKEGPIVVAEKRKDGGGRKGRGGDFLFKGIFFYFKRIWSRSGYDLVALKRADCFRK